MRKQQLKQLRRIDKRMIKAIGQSAEDDFERPHYFRVRYFAAKLAQLRGVALFEALMAAMLHDVGRIVMGIEGSGHAIVGGAYARELLISLGIPRSTARRIAYAIELHSAKKTVAQPLAELLKDADALSHRIDFDPQALPWQERMRCQLAFQTTALPLWMQDEGARGAALTFAAALNAAKVQLLQFAEALRENKAVLLSEDQVDIEGIHNTRNALRQLDTVLLAFKRQPQPCEAKLTRVTLAVKPLAKKLFRDLGPIRDAHVNNRQLALMGYKEYIGSLPQPICSQALLLRECDTLLAALEKAIEIAPQKIAAEGLLHNHRIALEAANSKDTPSLHRLRIQGKRLRILKNMGWLAVDEGLSKALDDYHKQVGSLLDTERLLRLVTTQHRLEPSRIEGLMNQLVSARNYTAQKTERALLALRLQCRFYYSAR